MKTVLPSAKIPSLSPADFDDRPWLIAGMGPTFSRWRDFDLSKYNILGLNKVCREIEVEICHIIDFYIVEKIGKHILKNARKLVMPYYPHFGYRPNHRLTLWNLALTRPITKLMQEEGRLYGYNLSTTTFRYGKSPIIRARYFSAEAAVGLLAHLGVRKIRTLGVDGGTKRAGEFQDHGPVDPRGFDLQWRTINSVIETFGLDFSALVPYQEVSE